MQARAILYRQLTCAMRARKKVDTDTLTGGLYGGVGVGPDEVAAA
jgi:hypothetical protein